MLSSQDTWIWFRIMVAQSEIFFPRTRYCSVMLYDQLLVTDSRVKLIIEYSFKCAPSLSFAHNHWDKALVDNHIGNSLETQWKVHGNSHSSDHRLFSGWWIAYSLRGTSQNVLCVNKPFFRFLSWCVYMYVGMYSCVRQHVGVHIHVHACGGQSLTLDVSIDNTSPYLLR